jgi:chloride channel protein, CIC family
MPGVVTQPGAFVIVGMAGFFAAVSNAPISTIILVSEMTDSFHLLLPSLLVCSVAFLAAQRWTIFGRQVKSKIESPAHAGEFFIDILQAIQVKDLMHLVQPVQMIPENMPFLDFKAFFSTTKQHYFPVMNKEKQLTGIFSSTDFRSVLFSQEIEHLVVVSDISTTDIIVATPSEDLNSVLKKFTVKNIDSLPVVHDKDKGNLIGMLNRREVIHVYNDRITQMKSQSGESDNR